MDTVGEILAAAKNSVESYDISRVSEDSEHFANSRYGRAPITTDGNLFPSQYPLLP